MTEAPRTCPECGITVAADFHFCPSCGIPLVSVVPAHGLERSSPTKAVAEDRRPSAPTVPPPADAASWKAERRLVSVLFIDLVGFTRISEQLDPEDVREMQSRYFESARASVARYGGSLEKFIGDAVMAVWGSPVAHENDGERAIRAALEMVRNIGSMAGTTEGRLQARAAVTTGEAAVSFDVVGEGMVTGDMVNTASRLQEAAPPGTVLVDDATRRAVGNAVEFSFAGEKSLKGKATPVRAWQAVDAARTDGTDAVAGHRGPFVGRGPEMTSFLELAKSVTGDGRTTTASVIGVAGIGKTRFARELERRLEAIPGLRWYSGRPPRWGQGSAFAPLAEMVRRTLGLAEGDPAEVVRRTLAEALSRRIPDAAERAWVEPRVQVLLDPSAPIQTEREELFAAWRRLLEAEAESGPIVLLFEDLQWADAETLDFIDYLAIWSRRNPILIMTLARPELLETRPTWGAGISHFRSMHLERLDDADVDELLASLAPELPRDVAARIRQRAEGVPLYAVEMARMLIERASEGSTVAAVSAADIPESLHALLAARIDALPNPERSLLLMAAVLGRRLRPEALAALSGMERRELGTRLGTLVRREFLAIDDEPRSPGRGQLSFVQDLMREVAYNTLSRRSRREYHLAVIDHLQGTEGAEAIEPIAEHLVAAHGALPAVDADAIADRAREALREAADRARALHAPHRALAHLERALALTKEPGARAGLAEAAALAARAAAKFVEAESHLREAIDLRESMGDAVASTRDRASLASVLLQAQRSETALAELESAWEARQQTGESDPGAAHLPAELARAYMLRGEPTRAIEWAERAIAAAGRGAEPEARALATDARITLGTALAQDGNPEEGLTQLRQAIDDAADTGRGSIELRARTNLAWLTVGDDPRATADTARRGLEIAHQLGNREWSLQLLDIAAIVAIDTGDWDWADASLKEAAGGELPSAYALDFAATRAIIGALRGAPDALAALDRLGAPEPDLDPQALGWVEIARAIAAMVAGDRDAALGLAQAAATKTMGYERAEALALAGRMAAWTGNLDAASAALADLEGEPSWGRATEARRQALQACVETLRKPGQARGAAARSWTGALRTWRSLNLPYREALCLADRWMLRGDDADREAAIGILDDLGAQGLKRVLKRRG